MHTVEPPTSWFEDVGRAQLRQGVARVEVDPDFAAVSGLGDDYHVFLTPEGPSNGLYVTDRSSTGFEVREQGEGTSEISFSYRIMTRRADVRAGRLERLERPSETGEGDAAAPAARPTVLPCLPGRTGSRSVGHAAAGGSRSRAAHRLARECPLASGDHGGERHPLTHAAWTTARHFNDRGIRVETALELLRVFGAGLQTHASFPLAHEELGQALQLLVAERLEVDCVERGGGGGFLGHRSLLRLGMDRLPGAAIEPGAANDQGSVQGADDRAVGRSGATDRDARLV
jgi:hypothetical protein